MKKIISLLIVSLLITSLLKAENLLKNDTTIRFNSKTVQINDSLGQISVKVTDDSSQAYTQVYEGVFSDEKSSEKWTVTEDFGIQIPFLIKKTSPKKYKMESHWAGIGWGFANISDASFQLNNIDGVSLKSESSNEFFFSVMEKTLPIYRNVLGITSGLGFNWRNYVLDKNTHFVEINDVIEPQTAPSGIQYSSSRLRIFSLTVPLLLEWQPNFSNNHNFFIAAGIVGNVNTFASSRVKYKDGNGKMIRDVETQDLNRAPLSLDYMAQIGYNSWGIYAKYSPTKIFQSEKGPNIRAVSLGVMLHF
jgi:uncharacterized protein YxeA